VLLLLLVLQVAPHEAARIANDGLQRLIAQKRLVLVLDLDHTLLNTGAPR
jgi:predicted secreted acid phosphatase